MLLYNATILSIAVTMAAAVTGSEARKVSKDPVPIAMILKLSDPEPQTSEKTRKARSNRWSSFSRPSSLEFTRLSGIAMPISATSGGNTSGSRLKVSKAKIVLRIEESKSLALDRSSWISGRAPAGASLLFSKMPSTLLINPKPVYLVPWILSRMRSRLGGNALLGQFSQLWRSVSRALLKAAAVVGFGWPRVAAKVVSTPCSKLARSSLSISSLISTRTE